MKILIVEDEMEIADGLAAVLEKENYSVDLAYDGLMGLECILSGCYDLILLDIMLTKLNGLDILKNVRKEGITVPIILVTAKSQIPDKIAGLDWGADDYITKPFDTSELLARIRARVRNRNLSDNELLSFNDITLNLRDCTLACGTKSIKLGNKEYQLMEYFINNARRILPKEMIVSRVWGPWNEAEYNSVEVYVSFLRKKLKFIESKTAIKTSKNLGYSLEEGE